MNRCGISQLDIVFATEQFGRQQIEQPAKPTNARGRPRFSFLVLYGEGRTDEERLQRFEKGLKLVEAIECPLILGDIPDASAAANGMLRPDQFPARRRCLLPNRRLQEWAAGRKQVGIVRLSDFMRTATANQALTIHGHTWRAGTTRSLLQNDKLHPSTRGCAAITLAIMDALLSTQSSASAGEIRWDPREVLHRGSDVAQVPAGQPAKRRRQRSQRQIRTGTAGEPVLLLCHLPSPR